MHGQEAMSPTPTGDRMPVQEIDPMRHPKRMRVQNEVVRLRLGELTDSTLSKFVQDGSNERFAELWKDLQNRDIRELSMTDVALAAQMICDQWEASETRKEIAA